MILLQYAYRNIVCGKCLNTKNPNNATSDGSTSHQTLGGMALSEVWRWLSHRLAAQTHDASIAPASTSVGQCAPR